MRSLWNGHISFGLVTIPVKLYSAVSKNELSFRLLHSRDEEPIRYERVCPRHGSDVTWDEVVKGYEYEKGKFVVLTDQDFRRADVEATRTIDILDFVEGAEVEPLYFQRPYYVEPAEGGERPYALLREALAETARVGVAKIVIRTRQHLGALQPRGEALVLNLMRFHDEIVDASELDVPRSAEVDPRELEMATRLIDNLTEPFDPARYKDDYREKLLRVIREKVEGRELEPVEEPEPSPQVIDIMSALKASLQQTERRGAARGRREAGGGAARRPSRGAGARSRRGESEAGDEADGSRRGRSRSEGGVREAS